MKFPASFSWVPGQAIIAVVDSLRSPLLVFMMIMNVVFLWLVYDGVAERRKMDNDIMHKLIDRCGPAPLDPHLR